MKLLLHLLFVASAGSKGYLQSDWPLFQFQAPPDQGVGFQGEGGCV